jgi:ribokinase
MVKVTVVGSFCVDILMRAPRMPVWGETLIGSDFYMGAGGKGGNQVAAVARMGARTSFVGTIGDDPFAKMAEDLFREEGIDSRHVEKIKGMGTAIGIGLLDPGGHSACVTDLGALAKMDEAFVQKAEKQIAASDVVLTMLEMPTAAAREAMRLGRKHGVMTILNPAPACELDEQVLKNTDILTPNESELRILMGLAPDAQAEELELAHELRKRGAKTVIVTLGEKGALIVEEAGHMLVPTMTVDAVDSTGAGDAFNAALAVMLAEGRPMVEAVQFANCAGALACTKLGAIPSYTRREVVEQVFRSQFGEDPPMNTNRHQ